MFIRFTCPGCQKILKVGDKFAGKTSKCPGCAAPVTVPAFSDVPLDDFATTSTAPYRNPPPRPPAADPFSFDAPGNHQNGQAANEPFDQINDAPGLVAVPGKWRGVQGGLRMVRTGTILQLTAVAIFLFLLLIVFFAGMQAFANFSTRPQVRYGQFERVGGPSRFGEEPSSQSADTGLLVLGGVLIAGLAIAGCAVGGEILRIIGLVRCVGVPAESGACGLAIATVIAELAPYGAMFLGCGLSLVHEALGNLMTLVQIVASLCAIVCFLLFLRQVGIAVGSQKLQARVVNYVIWLVAGICMYIGVVCLGFFSIIAIGVGASSMDGPPDVATMGMAGMIVIVTMFLAQLAILLTLAAKYLGLVQCAADEIRRRAGHLQTA